MKTRIPLFCLFVLVPFFVFSQSNFVNTHILDPYNPAYVKGVVLVKFTAKAMPENMKSSNGIARTGITSVDKLLQQYKVKTMDKVFKETRAQHNKKSARTIRNFNGSRIKVPALYNIYKLKFDTATNVKQLAKALQKDKNVDFAEPDYLFYSSDILQKGRTQTGIPKTAPAVADQTKSQNSTPNDPFFTDGSQPYLNTVDAPKAWTVTTGDSTQIVAILDTGVDWKHPDLKNNIWTNTKEIPGNGIDDDHNGYVDDVRGWDFINHDNNPNDDNSHGTHVAGIAAAEGNNGIGMTGVAWHAKIMPIKVMQSTGVGSADDIAKGVEYAADNGATVINMSLGGYGESQVLKTALENAYAGTGNGKGAILVASAGNDHLRVDDKTGNCSKNSYGVVSQPSFPGAYPFVIGVMASDAGPCSGFSNWDFSGPVATTNGFNYEMKAPGVNILSTKPNGNYWEKSGTSMSCPIVAGAVALLRSHTPSLNGEQIFARLIQGANNGVLNIYKSLTIALHPDLRYMSYTIVDTLPGDKANGVADAGDTIQLFLHLKNAGGTTDSVWSKIAFAPFEDTTTAKILDSTSFIGSIGTYAEMTGEKNPFLIYINPTTANNRDIKFRVTYGDSLTSHTADISFRVQNGMLYQGYVHGLTVLTPAKYYIITGNTVFDSLVIKPGTIIRLKDQASIMINQYFKGDGKPDSLITYTHNDYGYWGGITTQKHANISYSLFEYGQNSYKGILKNFDTISNNIFRYNGYTAITSSIHLSYSLKENIIVNNNDSYVFIYAGNFKKFSSNILADNRAIASLDIQDISFYSIFSKIKNNVFFNNTQSSSHTAYSISITDNWGVYKLSPNYFGTTDSTKIENMIEDYFENSSSPILIGSDSAEAVPSPSSHGFPWDVRIKNVSLNKYDHPYNASNGLGVVGDQKLRFTVYFNRPMDTAYTPLLTFGVRKPFTQHVVADSSRWSANSMRWSANYTIAQTTGDGIQQVRVVGAKDNEDFPIPEEYTRFQFMVQAAASASIDFVATPGIGKVKLEWPAGDIQDVQGYNIYRYHNLTDTTYSDTLLANNTLVTDTVFTDFNVIPDTTYHYLYKTLRTNMTETGASKIITAIPLKAANGDANGDQKVNILDLTTIVAYILGENPQPFLFDAADVNYDSTINVLDVISIVKLILGTKIATVSGAWAESPAAISMQDNRIRLKSDHQLAALQFELIGKNLKTVRLSSLLDGFEFSYGVVKNKIIGLVYSFTGKLIPGGLQDVIKIDKASDSLSWGKVFGSDINGNAVKVVVEGTTGVNETIALKNDLKVSPNPFSNRVTLHYQLVKTSRVQIEVYNLNGQRVQILKNAVQSAGRYALVWGAKAMGNRSLPSGIYLCKIRLTPLNGEVVFKKEVKLIKMR